MSGKISRHYLKHNRKRCGYERDIQGLFAWKAYSCQWWRERRKVTAKHIGESPIVLVKHFLFLQSTVKFWFKRLSKILFFFPVLYPGLEDSKICIHKGRGWKNIKFLLQYLNYFQNTFFCLTVTFVKSW